MGYSRPLHSGVLRLIITKRCLLKIFKIYFFALQDQYPEVTHGKKYLCSGGKHEISLFFVVMEMLVLFSLITLTWATFLLCIYRILYRFILVINYCVCLCFIRFYRLCINIPPSCGRSCHWRCWRWSVVLHQDIFGQAEKGVLNNICNNLWWEWLTTTAQLISSKTQLLLHCVADNVWLLIMDC